MHRSTDVWDRCRTVWGKRLEIVLFACSLAFSLRAARTGAIFMVRTRIYWQLTYTLWKGEHRRNARFLPTDRGKRLSWLVPWKPKETPTPSAWRRGHQELFSWHVCSSDVSLERRSKSAFMFWVSGVSAMKSTRDRCRFKRFALFFGCIWKSFVGYNGHIGNRALLLRARIWLHNNTRRKPFDTNAVVADVCVVVVRTSTSRAGRWDLMKSTSHASLPLVAHVWMNQQHSVLQT